MKLSDKTDALYCIYINTIKYVITVTNIGNANGTTVVKDKVPENTTLLTTGTNLTSAELNELKSNNGLAKTLEISAGNSKTVEFTVKVTGKPGKKIANSTTYKTTENEEKTVKDPKEYQIEKQVKLIKNSETIKTTNSNIVLVIDVSGSEGRDPVEDYHTINEELKKYSEKLATRKQILVANKIDVMQDDERLKELEELAKKEKLELFKISGVTGEGISELLNRVSEVLKTLPKEEIVEEEDKVIYTLDDDKEEFTVRKDGDTFVVEGKAVNRLMGRINIDDNESMYYFQKNLKSLGIEDELKRQGIKEGDFVKILNWTFEWYE